MSVDSRKIKDQYNSLSKEDLALFKSYHAPARIKKPQKFLVAVIDPIISKGQTGNTILNMPTNRELRGFADKNGYKVRTHLKYQEITRQAALSLLGHSRHKHAKAEDARGQLLQGWIKQSNRFYRLVEDVNKELEWLKDVNGEAAAPVQEAKAEDEPSDNSNGRRSADEWEAMVKEYNENKQMYSLKEFADKHGTTTQTLKKKIEKYG